ncbi:SpoIIE family protein phosphatase [Streptomyces sp. NBC_00510]
MASPAPIDLAGLLQRVVGVTGAALGSPLAPSAIGLALWNTDLRCTWVNDSLEDYDGIPRERRLGRRPDAALPAGARALEAVMRQVLATGTPVAGREYLVPAVDGVRREGAYSVSCIRLEDAAGRPMGVCLVVLRITGGHRPGDRLALLGEAGARVGTTLDVMRTAQELAAFTVSCLADYVTVDLADTLRLGEEPLSRLGPDGDYLPVFRRAGLASVREGAPEAVSRVGDVVYVPSSSPLKRVLSTGRSLLEPVLDTASAWLSRDPARAGKIDEFGMHSLMILPLRAHGVVLGVVLFLRTDDPRPFDEDDLLFAEELVARAALSLDNARRYTHERATALALQRGLLPRRVCGGPSLDVVSRFLPADLEDGVGGDWYDVIPLPRDRVALVVGDVVGHGIDAAATMGRLRTAVRTLADLDLAPEQLLAYLDQAIIRLAEEEGEGLHTASVSATCLYAVYDPASRRCTMARAGHPPPAVRHPGGGVTFLDLPNGTPLGLGMPPYQAAEVELPEGSLLALYTDGLIEDRRHDVDTGMERVRRALDRPGLRLDDLCSAVLGTLPSATPPDDVTLLIARTRAVSPAPSRPRCPAPFPGNRFQR